MLIKGHVTEMIEVRALIPATAFFPSLDPKLETEDRNLKTETADAGRGPRRRDDRGALLHPSSASRGLTVRLFSICHAGCTEMIEVRAPTPFRPETESAARNHNCSP